MKTILLLGNTGAGKSTFLELQFDQRLSSSILQSCTTLSQLYRFNNDVSIIDTPGIYDSEERTQSMMDDLLSRCYGYGSINCAIIFHRFNGKVDETLKSIIHSYSLLLNNKTQNIILCFTGAVTKTQKNELESYYKEFDVCIWNLHNTQTRDNKYSELYIKIMDKFNLEPIYTQTMQRIITFSEQIKLLKEEMNKMKMEVAHLNDYKDRINKLEQSKKAITYNNFRCTGLTRDGYRCSNSNNCYFLSNYHYGISPAHHSEIKLKPIDTNITLDELQQIVKENKEMMLRYKMTDMIIEEKPINVIVINTDFNIVLNYKEYHNPPDLE